VSALVAAQGERVDEHDRAASAAKGGLQDDGVIQVPAGAVERTGRVDGPVAGVLIEKSGEDRWAVEAGEAQPVHRALGRDEAADLQSDRRA
jgi:hypothetical protein